MMGRHCAAREVGGGAPQTATVSMRVPVLIIVENLPVPADRRVWQEALALRDAGYEVLVICPKMLGYEASEELLEGISIYRHPIWVEARGFWGFFIEYASALLGELLLAWRAWWRHRFRVIHICNPPDLLFLVAWPFKLLGVRVVFDVHDLWPEMFEAKFRKRGVFYWLVRSMERLSYRSADTVLATNETVRRIAISRGRKSAERVFVVRTAPDVPQDGIAPDLTLRRGRRFLVGYVGVMGNADGVDRLIEAASILVHEMGRDDIQFLLMGTGGEYEFLLRQRDEAGLGDRVDMPGWISGDHLYRALATLDLGVACDPPNPYNDGCTMNKVLEYMAFGKPQVMFDLKEGRASAGDAAVYVSGDSPRALAEAIARVLDDPEARRKMGEVGMRRIREEMNWRRSVESLLAAYRSLRGGTPGH